MRDKEQRKEYHRKWYEENKEQRKEQMRKYNEENKEQLNEQSRKYREEHKEYFRKWYEEHKEQRNEQMRKYYEEIRNTLINVLGGKKCVECGNNDYRLLEFHHINGDGPKDREENRNLYFHYINNSDEAQQKLQILCRKCHRKWHRKWPFLETTNDKKEYHRKWYEEHKEKYRPILNETFERRWLLSES